MSQWSDFEEPGTYQYRNYEQPESSRWSIYQRPETSTRIRLTQTELQRQELKKKSLELMEETNKAFKELTTTLSNEQIRLSELEKKRKHLLHQMMALKVDIEKEREACRLDLQDMVKNEAVKVETLHDEDEIVKKSKTSHRSSGDVMITEDYRKHQSREEITNDIVNRLTEFAKRSSYSSY